MYRSVSVFSNARPLIYVHARVATPCISDLRIPVLDSVESSVTSMVKERRRRRKKKIEFEKKKKYEKISPSWLARESINVLIGSLLLFGRRA